MKLQEKIDALKKENAFLRKEIDKINSRRIKSRRFKFIFLKFLSWFIIGVNLKKSILNLIDEFNQKKISKNAIADLGANIIFRLTRISLIALLIAVLPIFLLFQQNKLIKNQNLKIENQNRYIGQQTQLIEADRRSAQIFIMGEVISDVNKELEAPENSTRILSNTLVGRIISLSIAMKPYKYLENDSITKISLSPERGQLLISLLESKIDSAFFANRILRNADFSYSELTNANLKGANLENINLDYANLENANLEEANLKRARLKEANLKRVSFMDANLQETFFWKANLARVGFWNANLEKANLEDTNLKYSSFDGANLINATLRYSDLSHANLRNIILRNTNFSNLKSLDSATIDRFNWFERLRKGISVEEFHKEEYSKIVNLYKIDTLTIPYDRLILVKKEPN